MRKQLITPKGWGQPIKQNLSDLFQVSSWGALSAAEKEGRPTPRASAAQNTTRFFDLPQEPAAVTLHDVLAAQKDIKPVLKGHVPHICAHCMFHI